MTQKKAASMTRTYVHQLKLRRWFPPDDRFAAAVVRFCILREDFAIEMQGIYRRRITHLDAHSAAWRKMYFWRNLVRTLLEIRKTVESLNTIPEFKRALKKSPPKYQRRFLEMTRKLALAEPLIEEIRNHLGGHVLQSGIEKALNSMDPDRWGFLEVGRTLGKTHFKFTGELVGEVLLAGIPEAQRAAEVEKKFRVIADLLPVFQLADFVFTLYADHRRLLR